MADHGHAQHGADGVQHEPLPVKVYVGVLAALFTLTAITVGVARLDFGEWNLLVAMGVAVLKASLVVLYFMNLLHDHDRLNRLIFVGALVFLFIYLGGTLADFNTRGDVDPTRGEAAEIKGGAEVAPSQKPAPSVGAQPAGQLPGIPAGPADPAQPTPQ